MRSASEERQASKFRFLEAFLPHLRGLAASGREIVICGDFNIAHKEIDLKNWRSNQKNSGFLPEERAWLDVVFDEVGWVDAFRKTTTTFVNYFSFRELLANATQWSDVGRRCP